MISTCPDQSTMTSIDWSATEGVRLAEQSRSRVLTRLWLRCSIVSVQNQSEPGENAALLQFSACFRDKANSLQVWKCPQSLHGLSLNFHGDWKLPDCESSLHVGSEEMKSSLLQKTLPFWEPQKCHIYIKQWWMQPSSRSTDRQHELCGWSWSGATNWVLLGHICGLAAQEVSLAQPGVLPIQADLREVLTFFHKNHHSCSSHVRNQCMFSIVTVCFQHI